MFHNVITDLMVEFTIAALSLSKVNSSILVSFVLTSILV